MHRNISMSRHGVAGIVLCCLSVVFAHAAPAVDEHVVLATLGQARCVVHVPPDVMADDETLAKAMPYHAHEAERHRRRLRDSVHDLALYLHKLSGAQIDVLQHEAVPADPRIPILIGDYARRQFGAPRTTTPFRQGWRLVVAPKGIGLMGETDESTSYAIYELLERLGCRWFMPGELGEVVPRVKTLSLQAVDVSSAPDTELRNIWYADDAFKRRNRLGGYSVSIPHALEGYLTSEQREQNPGWRAVIHGKPHAKRLKWSLPEVSDAIADALIARLDAAYTPLISLVPDDGAEFDQSADTALDAGDWDPTMNQISITDRYIHLCNRIAERVNRKHPDVRFGILAYVQYTRPPVRETLHPNLIVKIAPITYCRAHAMTDAACPSRAALRPIVEGWGKVAAGRLAYYNYMFNLAEVAAPYPMMHQLSEELPILYRSGVTFWGPETLSNFESVLPGMWLSLRMAWDNSLEPAQVLDELFTKFHGAASRPMRRYWQIFDDAWTQVPAHAGSLWSYDRRFTPEIMRAARQAMDEALASAKTPLEYRRVKLFDASLRQFERFMQMRVSLQDGRQLRHLEMRATEWLGAQMALGNEYAENYGFSLTGYAPTTVAARYFDVFLKDTYLDAARITSRHSPFVLINNVPLRVWRYAFIAAQNPGGVAKPEIPPGVTAGEASGWNAVAFDDGEWNTTDAALDRWADIDMMTEFGTMWYRAVLKAPALPEGKQVFLWIAATDNSARLYVNGQAIPHVNATGETVAAATGFAKPFSFNVTHALKANADNQITIASTRDFLRELGTGGLMGPVYLYREK